MTAVSLLAEALVDAADAYDGDADDAHISIQLHEDEDGFEWWTAAIYECYEDSMTNWMNGEEAASDLTLIRDGKAEEVAERYADAWDDDWTEFHGEVDQGDEAA
ncbi:hypothetical protein J7376_06555 [Paracoccus sp. R12_1]|uniref:hypothetical protein n=1 Tax=unclassified Paracoccus (in: a-proteobacteria) TaxID=2688777 RepID=UPI001ADAC26B|nr:MULTISPECIES: hypothetical protein [unclassified Paracoccus (in: a-proteobacteria)]MBO9454622.1 hypothetical protein [Paracoccus sp. R12_2]MBO9486176.1 hypothetical protein [Paracoccus sp. R12_1]